MERGFDVLPFLPAPPPPRRRGAFTGDVRFLLDEAEQWVTRTLLDADVSRARRAELVGKLAAAYILQGAIDALTMGGEACASAGRRHSAICNPASEIFSRATSRLTKISEVGGPPTAYSPS